MAVNLSAKCPDCGSDVVFTSMPRLNQTVVCSNCEAALVVIDLNPIELDWVYDDDEMFADDFDDFEEDEDYDELDDYDEEEYDDD